MYSVVYGQWYFSSIWICAPLLVCSIFHKFYSSRILCVKHSWKHIAWLALSPGRWFASHLLKHILAYIAVHYNIQPFNERPLNNIMGEHSIPPPQTVIKVRRRKVDWKAVYTRGSDENCLKCSQLRTCEQYKQPFPVTKNRQRCPSQQRTNKTNTAATSPLHVIPLPPYPMKHHGNPFLCFPTYLWVNHDIKTPLEYHMRTIYINNLICYL